MRLRSLHIGRLPGIRPGFTLDNLQAGINVVVGPNASGKTSLLRALRAALYREELRHDSVDIEAEFEDARGRILRALRVGADLHWSCNGARTEPPPLPEHRFLPCYTLRIEDLLDEHAADSEIAERLARELAGGYDIRSVRNSPPFSPKATHGREESRELTAAAGALRKQVRTYHALQEDEARLDELRRQKESAEAAGREIERLERALSLLAARRDRRSLEEQRAEFPEGMGRLRGDELEHLEHLCVQRKAQASERERAMHGRASAEEALEQARLTGAELEEGTLSDYRRSAQQLQQLESRIEQKATELAEAGAALNETIELLGGEPGGQVRLDPATIQQIEQQLERKRGLEAGAAQLEHELARLPDEADPELDAERLRAGRRELLHWLSAPRDPAWSRLRIAAAAAVFAPALAGVVAAGVVAAGVTVHWAVLVLLLPLGWGAYVLLRPGAGEARRREACERFRQLALEEPASWKAREVLARLEALDGLVQQAGQQAAQLERRHQAERELAAGRRALEAVRGDLRAAAAGAGHDPDILDASLQRWIRLTAEHDRARRSLAASETDRGRLTGEADQLRAGLRDFLARYDEAPETPRPDAGTLSNRLEQLVGRIRQRDQAQAAIGHADKEIQRTDEALRSIERQINAVYERAGLDAGDEHNLRRRLEKFEAWKALEEKLREARARERDREQRLGDRPELMELVETGDEEALRERHERQREQAARLESLIQEITGIEKEIDRAGRARELEAARARQQRAEDALHERLDEALFAGAGCFLIEEVESEHVKESRPAALRRAAEWFRRFTHYEYELIFDADGADRFTALETTSGERRNLPELSSGTRMQLLLAVRIAFALEAEHGREALPLVLDEALTTADPERFQAAADSLRLLAGEEQRQVLYLTAQPDDARYWATQAGAPPCVIDLAGIRGRRRAIRDPARLTPAQRPEIPDSGTHSPEEYAVMLGVPDIDPWAGASEIHIFYLLRDDLPLLRRLLQLGIRHLGALRSLLDSEAVTTLLSGTELRRLRRSAAAAEAWIDAWRQGRGRPVDRRALEESGAVSEGFIDRVAELNDEADGDAAALIHRLGQGAVSRFRAGNRRQLEAWFTEHGYIDPRPPLSGTEIQMRMLAAMRAHTADGDGDDAVAEARLLAGGLESGVREAS